MKKIILISFFLSGIILAGNSSNSINHQTNTINPIELPLAESKVYFGGNIGFNFWNDYFFISAYPFIGYKITPKFSVGTKLGYSYISDDRYDPYPALNTHNLSGSVFSRYRITPQLYAHSEFVYASFEQIQSFDETNTTYETERIWVPFLLVGGGYSQKVGSNAWVFAEVLFDVLRDENSPYKKWDPFISVGMGVGF